MVAPVVEKDAKTRKLYLPRGARYFSLVVHFRDGQSTVVWAPLAATAETVESRKRELQAFLAHA